MPLNRDEAVTEMITVIAGALGPMPTTYPNGPDIAQSVKGQPWARVTIRHAKSERATIGVRRERHRGLLFVQYMLPVGTGADLTYSAPQPLLDALTDCRTPGGVWFRNVSLFEPGAGDGELTSGENGDYFVVTVQAEFTYDEIRGK